MNLEHNVVPRLFKALLEREQLALVASAVVVLTFTGHSPDEVGVCVVGVAEGVGCNVDVVGVVATFLTAFNVMNADVAYLVPGRVDIVAGNPSLTGIMDAGDKVADVLFLLLD